MTGIGHNHPPTPFDEAAKAIADVWSEAKHWLDGSIAQTQAEADAIGRLLDEARKAKKAAEAAHKAEKEPHLVAGRAVDARYKPLTTKCDTIADAAKKALAPFLASLEAAKREREAAARAEAETARKAAQEALQAASGIEAREAAERLVEQAHSADIKARVAAKDAAKAAGGARSVSLRTTIVPEIEDMAALLRWIFQNDRSALEGFARDYAAGAFRAGQRVMDGVRAVEQKQVA